MSLSFSPRTRLFLRTVYLHVVKCRRRRPHHLQLGLQAAFFTKLSSRGSALGSRLRAN